MAVIGELTNAALRVPPKPALKPNHVETVRQIVNLALGDGMEIVVLMALLHNGNEKASVASFQMLALDKPA